MTTLKDLYREAGGRLAKIVYSDELVVYLLPSNADWAEGCADPLPWTNLIVFDGCGIVRQWKDGTQEFVFHRPSRAEEFCVDGFVVTFHEHLEFILKLKD